MVVVYRYDPWGRPVWLSGSMSDTLGALNPFRYRGYVYDAESGLYYLRSRYYNPNWGRFISADSILGRVGSLLQHNLFAYCCNTPVNLIDSNGKMGILALAASISITYGLVSNVFSALAVFYDNDKAGQQIIWHWIYGRGKTKVISNDKYWNEYLLANDDFRNAISREAEKSIVSGLFEFTIDNMHLEIGTDPSGEGGYRNGYDLINGTNFSIKGNVVPIENGYYTVKAYYEFNDVMDPNPKYPLDYILVALGYILFSGVSSYKLKIEGAVEYTIRYIR